MIVLVEKRGTLAQAPEAVLRIALNRENREWFYRAADISLSAWATRRDAEIARILNSLDWLDIWNVPDGNYAVREGMGKTLAYKRGDVALLTNVSAKGNVVSKHMWKRGTPCPYAMTPDMIAARWEDLVHEWRMHTIACCLPEDCVSRWDAPIREAARACLSAAANRRWQDALAIARHEPYWLPLGYLETLVEG